MPFGAASSVAAWWRFGQLIVTAMRTQAGVALTRFVDDFSGVSRDGLEEDLSGHGMLKLLTDLLNTQTDIAKSLNKVVRMVVLGAEVVVDMAARSFAHRVCRRKATKWIKDFKRAATTRHLDAGSASKAAGRVGFAVTVAHNKVGRAYARPLHRQAHAPLGGGFVSPWLLQCLHWWIAFLDQVADSWKFQLHGPREHVRVWTDAASHNHGLAAVMYFRG